MNLKMLETELEKKTGPDPPGGRPGSGSGVRKAKPLVRASSMDRPSRVVGRTRRVKEFWAAA